MKFLAISGVLIFVFLLQPRWVNAQRIGEKDGLLCILYVSAYDCASCRMSFSDFIKRKTGVGDIAYKIAIRFQRRKEFAQFMHNQTDPDTFIEADAEFLKRYPQIKTGDIVLVSKKRDKVRTNIYDKNWEKALARAIHEDRRDR